MSKTKNITAKADDSRPFAQSEIITRRPDDMSFEQYREIRREQTAKIKTYLRRGILRYTAAELYIVRADGIGEIPATRKNATMGTTMRRTWPPYRRPKTIRREAVDKLLTAND